MTPIVFINCDNVPYVDMIISGKKKCETRNRNTLGALVGHKVLIAETRHGKKPKIRCSAVICSPAEILDKATWNEFRDATCVPEESCHDWHDKTKQKLMYYLLDVSPVSDMPWVEGKRHGRVWMEYED